MANRNILKCITNKASMVVKYVISESTNTIGFVKF